MASRGDINLLEVQPKLYDGWQIIPFDKSLSQTGTYTKIKSTECNDDGIYPVIDQGEKYISGYIDDPDMIYKGELPVIIFGDHTRNIKYIDFEFAAGADGTKILSTIKQIDSKFFYFYLKSLSIPSLGYSRHYSILKQINIPLPPLAEQKRIADKLDVFFSQLDTMRKASERISELIKNLRKQILTYAITGKLTEEWRQGKKLDEWKSELASQCCQKVQNGGTPQGGLFENSGIPFLKVYNIVQNKIDFEYEPQYVSKEIQNSQIKKSIAYPGDVVMNIVGPPLNKIAIIPDTYPEWNLNQAITLFRTKDYLDNKFLYYFFCEGSPVNSLINQTRGVVGQVNISLSQCRNFMVSIPPIEEQKEIVNRVQSLFDKVDIIEQRYQTLKAKLDNLPQALLYKAFKGELVEQLPSDGNATDLLNEIEQLKKSLGKK